MLRRLAAPLSILALASGTFAYWLAWQYTAHVVDRSLVDLANAVAQQIRISGDDARLSVPPLARAMFSDPVDQLVYRVTEDDSHLAGQQDLPGTGTGVRRVNQALVFDARFRGTDVRIAQVRVPLSHGRQALVEVGQRVERRLRLAAEFLLAIMTPLLLLLVAGWLIVWRVVNQQLIPLTTLADTLNRQTHMSLEPVDETLVPAEIRPLTGALNALLERLGIALDAQRKFIADAAHQLRTPLTAVKLHADQAATSTDPRRVATAIQELRSSANRAVRLSNQLLSLARAEPGEQAAHFVMVNVSVLAFETGAEWVPRSLARRVDLGFQSWPDLAEDATDPDAAAGLPAPLYVRGNPTLLREVLANLIDNALKYVPPHRPKDARITVKVGRVDVAAREYAELIVEDNGPGVDAAVQHELFERFFRGDANPAAEGGAGLGLAIVQDIIRLHQGAVRYEDAPGGGSRFVVRLPLYESHPESSPSAAPGSAPLVGQHGAPAVR
ncbi:MAG: sensor histidine kinase [Janthinobacterium lividum]